LVAILGVSIAIVENIHPFLAVTQRVPAETMIVEGWAPPSAMKQAAAEFLAGGYKRLILLRPILDEADKYESGRYNGDFMANTLVACGVPREKEMTLFPIVAEKDRTYHSALAAKARLQQLGLTTKSLDVVTIGPHARRSRLMYEEAFGSDVQIGIIALKDRQFDALHWWRTSEGVREVIGETIAYIYARVFFRPAPSE